MPMLTAFRERTVIRTFAEDDGDDFVELYVLEGVTLPVDEHMPIFIDGVRCAGVAQRILEIDIKARMITTTITVLT